MLDTAMVPDDGYFYKCFSNDHPRKQRIGYRFGFKQTSNDTKDLRGHVAFSPLRVDAIKLSGVGLETMFR